MALYFYSAFSKDGKKVTGYMDVSSAAAVKEQLAKQALYPIKIAQASEQSRQSFFQRFFGRGVPIKEKILFTKQLAVLLKSGVPLLQALELLVDQFEGKMHSILVDLKDTLKEGGSLADGLKKYSHIFDATYIQLVRAGEASGKLEIILERLTVLLERQAAIAKRVRAALSYPLIQLVVALGVVTILIVYVVPQMAGTFASQNKELPTATQFLLALSGFVTNHIVLFGLMILGAIVGFKYWKSTPTGARTFDEIILRLPLIGHFARMKAVVQFSRTLGMLVEGGVNLAESLDIVVKIIDNRVLADTLNEARDKIIKQGKIAQYLKQTNIFPPIAIYLINTGEQSGQLDFMLLTVAQNYEEELTELADGLAAKIGPILLIVMALVVGFIVMAIALPVVQMSDLAGAM